MCIQLVVVDTKPATHRQPDKASSDAGFASEMTPSSEDRVNNLGLVTEVENTKKLAVGKEKKLPKELLHLGLDYSVINIAFIPTVQSRSISFCDSIFSFPHNDSNADEIPTLNWPDSDEVVSVHFSFTSDKDEVAIIFRDADKIMVIQKVTNESLMRSNIGYIYDYRISCYGAFFSLIRLGEFDPKDFLGIFLRDIAEEKVQYSLSRVDVCADISNVSPQEIIDGIQGDFDHMKKISVFQETINGDDAETINYGKKGMPWFARVYNKLIELTKKGKQRYFTDYIAHQKEVTRLEIQFDGTVLREHGFLPNDCLDTQRIYSLYAKHLFTKYVQWNIFRFLKKEMKRRGFKFNPPIRVPPTYDVLSKDEKFRRTEKSVKSCAEAWGESVESICKQIISRSDNA